MIYIANPIYDVVFKYLMDDSKIAKLLISKITGLTILELHFEPQEYATTLSSEKEDAKMEILKNIAVYRLDFSAKIKTDQGTKHVLIEIQKAKFSTMIPKATG